MAQIIRSTASDRQGPRLYPHNISFILTITEFTTIASQASLKQQKDEDCISQGIGTVPSLCERFFARYISDELWLKRSSWQP